MNLVDSSVSKASRSRGRVRFRVRVRGTDSSTDFSRSRSRQRKKDRRRGGGIGCPILIDSDGDGENDSDSDVEIVEIDEHKFLIAKAIDTYQSGIFICPDSVQNVVEFVALVVLGRVKPPMIERDAKREVGSTQSSRSSSEISCSSSSSSSSSSSDSQPLQLAITMRGSSACTPTCDPVSDWVKERAGSLKNSDRMVQAIIVCGDSESSLALHEELVRYRELQIDIRSHRIVGGYSRDWKMELKNTDVVVVTPGRFLDLVTNSVSFGFQMANVSLVIYFGIKFAGYRKCRGRDEAKTVFHCMACQLSAIQTFVFFFMSLFFQTYQITVRFPIWCQMSKPLGLVVLSPTDLSESPGFQSKL